MKRNTIAFILLFVLVFPIVGYNNQGSSKAQNGGSNGWTSIAEAKESSIAKTTESGTKKRLFISGMMCGKCAKHVTKALSSVKGVKVLSVKVGYADILLTKKVKDAVLIKSIKDAGYKLKSIRQL
jgi:copper chaperone CopZ